MSFIFDPQKGQTPQSVARQREIAAMLLGQIGYRPARNTGEGIGNALASIGAGIAARAHNKRADEAERIGQGGASDWWQTHMGSGNQFPAAPMSASGSPANNFQAEPLDPASARVAQAHGGSPYRDAIASIESDGSGGYAAVGPTHKTLGRALGRYQVMEANIGPWSEKHLGRRVTTDEFMQNPAIQDAIFDGEFGEYVNRFGPEGAAQAWFGGAGGVGKLNRRDSLGTSIGAYTQKFNNAMGQQPNSAAGATEAMASGQMAAPQMNAFAGPEATSLSQAPVNAEMPIAGGGGFAPMPSNTGPSLQELMAAAGDPWLMSDPGKAQVINMLLQQAMQSQDPMRQLEMDYKRAQIDALQNPTPDPTSGQRNYDYLRSLGLSHEDAVSRAFSGGTTVNVNGQSARDQADAALLKDVQDNYGTALRLKPALARARQAIERAPDGYAGRAASMWGSIAGGLGLEVPEGASEAQILSSITTQLAGLYRLPGPVSDAEMQLYMQAAPRLGDTRAANLAKIELFERLMERSGKIVDTVRRHAGADNLYDHLAALDEPIFTDDERGNLEALIWGDSPTEDPSDVPNGVDPGLWEYMTPEERRAFQ